VTSSTKTCPYCAEEIRSEAVKCRFCGSRLDRSVIQTEWTRTERGKMIAGVCAGLAEQFDISVTVIRLAFVLASLFSAGTGILVYVILWIVMPVDEDRDAALWPSDVQRTDLVADSLREPREPGLRETDLREPGSR
jgi:phage shock protein PspC (stress-responsive transcriptional regulator)